MCLAAAVICCWRLCALSAGVQWFVSDIARNAQGLLEEFSDGGEAFCPERSAYMIDCVFGVLYNTAGGCSATGFTQWSATTADGQVCHRVASRFKTIIVCMMYG